MKDEEAAALLRKRNPSSSETTGDDGKRVKPFPPASGGLPPRHPINLLYRCAVIGGSLWLLHHMEVFVTIMRGAKVNHMWFKAGLAASIAIQILKGYIELYDGKSKQQKIEYANYRHETHALLFLFLFASLSFHIALWPAFGGANTIFILFLLGWGVLLQIAILLPTWVQNIGGIASMTFLLQQYQ